MRSSLLTAVSVSFACHRLDMALSTARVDRSPVGNFTDIETVVQWLGDRADTEPYPTSGAASGEELALRANGFAIELLCDAPDRAEFR